MTVYDNAVKAATKALHDRFSPHREFAFTGMDAMAEVAVAAAAPILLAEAQAEIERLQAVVEYEQGGWDYYDAEVAKGRAALAAERALIADLRALCDSRDARSEVQFPNTAGVVATGTIRDLLDRHAARIAETAPEDDPLCPSCGQPMTVHDVGEGWICNRHPRIAETAPKDES